MPDCKSKFKIVKADLEALIVSTRDISNYAKRAGPKTLSKQCQTNLTEIRFHAISAINHLYELEMESELQDSLA